MRTYLTSLIVIIALQFLFCPSVSSSDRTEYTIDVEYVPDSQFVEATETIEFVNQTGTKLDSICLQLFHNALSDTTSPYFRSLPELSREKIIDGGLGKIDIESIKMAGDESDWYLREGGKIAVIKLSKSLNPEDSISFELVFKSILPPLVSRWGYFINGASFTYWYPQVCPHVEGDWLVQQLLSYIEPHSDFADYDVSISVPSQYQVAATGRQVHHSAEEGKSRYNFMGENVIDFAWSAATYEINEFDISNVTVRFFTLPGYDHKIERMRGAIEGTINFAEKKIGVFPYTALTVAQVPSGQTAMEFPMFVAMNITYNPLESVQLEEHLITRGILHQYFYASLAFNQYLEPWMDEGLSNFLTGEAQKTYGDTSLLDIAGLKFSHSHARRLNAYSLPVAGFVTQQSHEFEDERSYRLNVVGKASLFFRALKNLVGDDDFYNALSAFYETHSNSAVNSDDLHHLFVPYLISSGIDLKQFLNFYLRQNRTCDYALGKVEVESFEADDTLYFKTSFRVVNNGSGWLPVFVTIDYIDEGSETKLINSDGYVHKFEITSESHPIMIEIDREGLNQLDKNLINNSYAFSGNGKAKSVFQSGALFYLECFLDLIMGM
ncbi:MAG: hypothetical protein GF315_07315 [candidate division Zixibacteria bacterium]|nr:hypothetical protein [candidate division Zixibacteria bacterium]